METATYIEVPSPLTFYIEVPEAIKLYRKHDPITPTPTACDIEAFLERCMDRKCRVAIIPVDTHVKSSKAMDLKEITAAVSEYMTRS